MLEIVTKVIGWIIQVLPIFIILRPRPRTYASTSPLLLLQLHQQQQLLSINIINSTNHHLQHAKLRILLQHLTSHAAYERSGGPPKRPAAKRPCNMYVFWWESPTRTCYTSYEYHHTSAVSAHDEMFLLFTREDELLLSLIHI